MFDLHIRDYIIKLICRVPMRVKWRYSSLPNVQISKSRNDTLSQLLVAHCMPYFSVLGILKYDRNSLVGQLTKSDTPWLILLKWGGFYLFNNLCTVQKLTYSNLKYLSPPLGVEFNLQKLRKSFWRLNSTDPLNFISFAL